MRFDKFSSIRVTQDWQYVHKQDLETLLGLPRVDIRGKTTKKVRYHDSAKIYSDRGVCKAFIHIKHVRGLCRRSLREKKADWVLKKFTLRNIQTAMRREKMKKESVLIGEQHLADTILDVLENFWTRLPTCVVKVLENAIGQRGMVAKLRATDLALRREDEKTQSQEKQDELDRAAIELVVALATDPRREEKVEETKCEDDV